RRTRRSGEVLDPRLGGTRRPETSRRGGHRRLDRLAGGLELAADELWFVDQVDAEGPAHAVAHLTREGEQVLGSRSPTVGEREDVLGRQRGGRRAVSLGEARVLDEPGRAGLDGAVGLLEARGA